MTAEIVNGCLMFRTGDGSLAAMFDYDWVLNWQEIKEDDLLK